MKLVSQKNLVVHSAAGTVEEPTTGTIVKENKLIWYVYKWQGWKFEASECFCKSTKYEQRWKYQTLCNACDTKNEFEWCNNFIG